MTAVGDKVLHERGLSERLLFGEMQDVVEVNVKDPVPGLRSYVEKLKMSEDPDCIKFCGELEERLKSPFAPEDLPHWRQRIEQLEKECDVILELQMPELVFYEGD